MVSLKIEWVLIKVDLKIKKELRNRLRQVKVKCGELDGKKTGWSQPPVWTLGRREGFLQQTEYGG